MPRINAKLLAQVDARRGDEVRVWRWKTGSDEAPEEAPDQGLSGIEIIGYPMPPEKKE